MNTPARHVVLGVTGSIAAYKAAELVRLFTKASIDVHVIMTRSAMEFITPLTLGTLSGNPVTTGMFEDSAGGPYVQWGRSRGDSATAGSAMAAGSAGEPAHGGIRHIQVSRESDLIVVAPASGNVLGKVAHGIADDALTTAIMASTAPVLFAPAMNTKMWENPAVKENVRLLKSRGYLFVQPGSGELACGEVGAGRMAEPEEILGEVLRLLAPRSREGPRLLVTAGRTEEQVDPVRYLSNRSSGRMGYALAEAGRDLGMRVTLISGVASVDPPSGVELVRVRTAEEMHREVTSLHASHEILIMAAAVADYRPRRVPDGKIPSGQSDLELNLVPTTDILASLRGRRAGKVTVGFALETSQEKERARQKLERKGCDMIVLNNPLRPGSEFGGQTNEVMLLYADDREERLPLMSKADAAREILLRARSLLDLRRGQAAAAAVPADSGDGTAERRPYGRGRGARELPPAEAGVKTIRRPRGGRRSRGKGR